jgi:hypothetical protein
LKAITADGSPAQGGRVIHVNQVGRPHHHPAALGAEHHHVAFRDLELARPLGRAGHIAHRIDALDAQVRAGLLVLLEQVVRILEGLVLQVEEHGHLDPVAEGAQQQAGLVGELVELEVADIGAHVVAGRQVVQHRGQHRRQQHRRHGMKAAGRAPAAGARPLGGNALMVISSGATPRP